MSDLDNTQSKAATDFTKEKNKSFYEFLNFSDRQDFIDADRGFIAESKDPTIKNDVGGIAVDFKSMEFLKNDDVPDTVNPSLWRISQLNIKHGLYKVVDRIYQIRGVDISNMTIIEGKKGIIIIDPLMSLETARAGLNLYYENVPQPKGKNRPVVAVIYTHSHADHFGGVKGVIKEDDAKKGKIKVVAPIGFLEEAVSENVYAGNAMGTRAVFMYGRTLPRNEKGYVGVGLGGFQAYGSLSLIAPNDIIKVDGETRKIDGVKIEFQLAQETEAPAEMMMYFPDFKALCSAEDATQNLHNLYTLRGAQIRKADKWWKSLNETIIKFGDRSDVVFAQHHWPKWGKENIIKYLENERDGWKYLNDKTLNLANKGYTPNEIAEVMQFPKDLNTQWYMRNYYGTVNHNSKAVYQRYLGWYDGNPANLYQLPPEESAKRYVDFMGGAENIIKKAKEYFEKGDYRFVVEVLKHVVFADSNNQEARNLQADAMEQLGYQSEAATWRNVFLTGAYKLRNESVKSLGKGLLAMDVLSAMTNEMVVDFLSISLNIQKSEDKKMKINWTNGKEKIGFELRNSIFVYTNGIFNKQPDLSFETDNLTILAIFNKVLKIEDAESMGKLKITTGTRDQLQELVDMVDVFEPGFNIVLP